MFTTFVPHFNDHVHFLRTLQYFLMKFCTNVSSITFIVTALKKSFHIISLSLLGAILGYFGTHLGYFGGHFENFLIKFCMDILGSFYFKWWNIFEAWTWLISEFDKKLLYYIRYDNSENFSLISCTDYKTLLFKVCKVGLKASRFGVQSKSTWFLELYISGSTSKVVFYMLKLL